MAHKPLVTFPWLLFLIALAWAYRRERQRQLWRKFWADELERDRRRTANLAKTAAGR